MKLRLSLALLTFFTIAVGQRTYAQAVSQAQWQQDIDAFTGAVSARGRTISIKDGIWPRGQRDFAKLYPPEKFNAEIATLKASLGSRPNAEIVLQLARIVASAHVAHNLVELPEGMGFERRLPVFFSWVSDDLIVSHATPAYREAVGARVLKIGDMTPEELLQGVEPLISYENSEWRRGSAPQFLTYRPVLADLRQIDGDGNVRITLEHPGHEPSVLRLLFIDKPQLTVNLYQGLGIPVPMRNSHPEKNYWYRYLEDSQTAYIQFSRCENDSDISFNEFTRTTMADMDARVVKRVVIDLRRNGGGNSSVIRPLIQALKARGQWKGHIYVLTSPGTFSSAVMNAIELKHKLHAKFVGGPTGGKPNCYGQPRYMKLPNSGLVVHYTIKFFRAPKGIDGPTLTPDIPVTLTMGDLLSARDPVLDAAVAAN